MKKLILSILLLALTGCTGVAYEGTAVGELIDIKIVNGTSCRTTILHLKNNSSITEVRNSTDKSFDTYLDKRVKVTYVGRTDYNSFSCGDFKITSIEEIK